MVNSLSSRYFSAVRRILGTCILRKIWERPLNHPVWERTYPSKIFQSTLVSPSIQIVSDRSFRIRPVEEGSILSLTPIFSACMRYNCIEGDIRPLDGRLQRIEVLGSISNDLIHEWKSLNGSAFDDIDDDASDDPLQFLSIGQRIDNPASNGASKWVSNHHHILIRETLQKFLEHLHSLTTQGLDRVVIVIVLLFRRTMAFQVESQNCTEVLHLSSQCRET